MKDDGIKGLIVFPVGEDAEREGIARVVKSGEIPIVLVDRYFPDLDTDYVVADNYTGGYRATEHLLILGHRRIGFVYTHASTLNITSLNQRYSGYRNAIESYGLDYDDSLVVQRTAHGGYEDFLSRQARPDAVFAASDLEALLILRAAHKHHIRVPDDLALVGFDDLTFAHLSNPPLTTVAQPRTDIGLRASNLLIDRLEHLRATTKQIVLPTNLIVRESCGAKTQVKRSIAGD
jgi:DNA-binding LacI/PurR family transcriptional regulator